MFDAEEVDKSSLESSINTPSSIENERDKSIASNAPENLMLFKLCITFKEIHKMMPGIIYRVSFFSLPPFDIIANRGKSIVFPMMVGEFSRSKPPNINIEAFHNVKSIGSGEINFLKEIMEVLRGIETGAPFDILCTSDIPITKHGRPVGKIISKLQLFYLGQNIVEDIDSSSVDDNVDQCDDKDIDKYDEYCADVNGYGLKIKVLRKNKKDSNEDCICESSKSKENIQFKPVEKRGSQLIFQLPSTHDICKKGSPRNVKMYTVGPCPNKEKHNHENGKIKVQSGISEIDEGKSSDFYTIKIGKGVKGKDDSGRLELELRAPKPIRPEDLKKKMVDVEVQTVGDTSKKGKKKKGGK